MGQVVIENPILNSPFSEPTWHFKFSDEGITNEIINARRTSSYFIPVAQPKKKGKQLLCEQVVGRGLRRMNYVANAGGMFELEYAEVYGVPFSFIPCSGSNPKPKPGPIPTRVRALEERIACEITFPRLIGYRYELPSEKLTANFTQDSIIEVTGEKKKDKAVKVATARTLWVPAINNHGGFGHWVFIEIDDPWNAQNAIRKGISTC